MAGRGKQGQRTRRGSPAVRRDCRRSIGYSSTGRTPLGAGWMVVGKVNRNPMCHLAQLLRQGALSALSPRYGMRRSFGQVVPVHVRFKYPTQCSESVKVCLVSPLKYLVNCPHDVVTVLHSGLLHTVTDCPCVPGARRPTRNVAPSSRCVCGAVVSVPVECRSPPTGCPRNGGSHAV